MYENLEYFTFWDTLEFFKESEFICPCGCTTNNIEKQFVSRLHDARVFSAIPFNINSACRCKKHNASDAVKGSETSSHLKGLAVDINIANSHERMMIVTALLLHGFNRIGIYKNFIHVDCDLTKTQNVIWYK